MITDKKRTTIYLTEEADHIINLIIIEGLQKNIKVSKTDIINRAIERLVKDEVPDQE